MRKGGAGEGGKGGGPLDYFYEVRAEGVRETRKMVRLSRP